MPPSPNAELVKALGRRDLAEAEAAARDLERVEPEHALAIVLLMGDEDDSRFEPALIRWVGLWLARHPQSWTSRRLSAWSPREAALNCTSTLGFELAVDLVRALAERESTDADDASPADLRTTLAVDCATARSAQGQPQGVPASRGCLRLDGGDDKGSSRTHAHPGGAGRCAGS
jgi:hypothetical protein